MTLGLLSLLIIVFLVMAVGAKRQARTIISERLRDLSLDVTEWRNNYQKIRETTDSGALAKTRMLARMIQYDPDILKSNTRIKELAEAAGYKMNSTSSSTGTKPKTGVAPSGGNKPKNNTSGNKGGIKPK